MLQLLHCVRVALRGNVEESYGTDHWLCEIANTHISIDCFMQIYWWQMRRSILVLMVKQNSMQKSMQIL